MGKDTDRLKQLFNRRLQATGTSSFYAIVTAVDEQARTCSVKMEDIIYENILLYSLEKPELKGYVLIPAVGSTVLVSRISGERYFVAMFSGIDKLLLTIGEKVSVALDASELTYTNDQVSLKITASGVELTADEIKINGGSFDGLVKIRELEKNLDSLKAFAEAIHAAIPTALSSVGAAMAANGALGKTSYDGAMAGKSVTIGDMENPKIKH